MLRRIITSKKQFIVDCGLWIVDSRNEIDTLGVEYTVRCSLFAVSFNLGGACLRESPKPMRLLLQRSLMLGAEGLMEGFAFANAFPVLHEGALEERASWLPKEPFGNCLLRVKKKERKNERTNKRTNERTIMRTKSKIKTKIIFYQYSVEQ